MSTSSILTQIPENTSFLQSRKHTFVIPTLPFLKYFVQSTTLPGIGTSAVQVSSPFADMYRHGDKLVFDPFTLTVIVDEDIRVWEETWNWLVSLTKPKQFTEYVKFNNANGKPYHDALLTLNNNANIPNVRIKFTYCHPVSMSALQLSAIDNADTIVTCDITFRYDQMEIQRV